MNALYMLDESIRYRLLKLLEHNPRISQRQLAQELGVSLGKVNFCLTALIDKGLLKANNFRNSQNKLAYMYLLTPAGMEEKAKITLHYLKTKMQEYETLHAEIEDLRREASALELRGDA